MRKRSSIVPPTPETVAVDAIAEAAEGLLRDIVGDGKNPAAVMLGRRGGLKGGKARAESLSAQRRSEISRNAAKARWRKRDDG